MRPCPCRDCMDIAVMGLCPECEQNNCIPYAEGENLPSYFYNCQRNDEHETH